MWFDAITDRGPTAALVATLSFTEARHRVLAENIANLGTPGYKARQLDVGEFQRAMGEAMDRRAAAPAAPFRLQGREFRSGPRGGMEVTPSLRPVDAALLHDGSNVSLEREMADLADNAMGHQTAARLLEGKFEGLRRAIRGRL